ncbi:YbhB/YbcL family Raf kinase inhibitor-like protein [Maritalea sp.]|jgi:phosphatidylethanolamine-binding protein (PEBP) family uncharacterized protein|uniref:YbhB/YbcL family Raf kinase inhibitor-like protein n=1 Tax=Maritalea sp. TaxID=2003361 RepID=UPI0039E3006A
MFRFLIGALLFTPTMASAMEFTFSWGETPACNTGWPDTIGSPQFDVSDVPEGTIKLNFSVQDLDAPGFSHGGGTISYDGESAIGAGAFMYKGPCPPNGKHEYQWTMTALDFYGAKLEQATATLNFPE